MSKLRCTEPYRKQVLWKLWAESVSSSANYLPKMRFKNVGHYEVLWKLWFSLTKVGASEQKIKGKYGRY